MKRGRTPPGRPLVLAGGVLLGFLWGPAPPMWGAEPASQETHPGASLGVYLMTMGQGDAVWEQFGHNALWVENRETGRSIAFNWGIFDFDQVDFVPRFVRGTMLYRMAPFDPEAALVELRRLDRQVWIQELALTPAQKAELLAFAEWNARPENQYYRYDYYRDNCSTRVRDLIDRVLGGRLRSVSEADTTEHSFRWHTRRLLQGFPAAYVGIQAGLGPGADRDITAWEEMFLPMRLMERIRAVQIPDGAGGMRPLVAGEREFPSVARPPAPAAPPFAAPWFLLVGVLWGGGILLLARRGSRLGAPGRFGLFGLAGGWALLATVFGSIFIGAWLFTDHVFWYRNLNLLQFNPLFLPLLPAFGLFLQKGTFPGWGRDVAAALGVIAAVGWLVGFLPGMNQSNGEILALTLPVNASLVLASTWLFRSVGAPDSARPGR